MQSRATWTPAHIERLPEDERFELLRGEPLPVSPAGFEHGDLVLAFGGVLRAAARRAGAGRIVSEVGFRLTDDALLAPDLALVAPEAVPSGAARRRMIRGAPRLAVEIVSPDQDAGELAEKIAFYFNAGTDAVWVLYPGRVLIAVHTANQPVRLLREADVLDGGVLIPGFAMSASEVFAFGEVV
jgi:Uma2 family endonuclease